jgi:signal transduction histidine kinase/DNA-binding response OmpR family regulator
MHFLLKQLARQRLTNASRYGLTTGAVAVATLLRLIAPLDTAPFLLYLPITFLASLAFGWAPGLLGIALSDLLAAYLFLRDSSRATLTASQVVALIQFPVVGGITVAICDVLRRTVLENEAALVDLVASQASLETAKGEAEAAREQAEEANQAKSTFIANMSHELRTPLSAIIGYSEMMAEEIADGCEPSDLAGDMAKVEGNARHLLGLINDVLDLSKVESGKMDVFAEDFAVEPMLRDVAATVDALVTKKGNTLQLDLAPELGDAYTDLVKLRQMLLNLLSNAAKFTENGTIVLRATREIGQNGDAWLHLAVRDSGIGMSAEELAKLFQRFTQADASTTRRFGGTGLGLSLTKALAEMLGGSVSVESAPDQGSGFTLHLPATYTLSEAPQAEAPQAPEPPTDDEDPAWELVLVIDDDPDQRALMTRVLHREKFRVEVAADGRSGLAQARRMRPRAILLDVMMPGIDGWSVLTELKSDPELSTIPVVMVTAVDQRSLAASLGATDYMLKPLDWDRFSEVVNRFRTSQGGILLVEDEFAIRSDICAVLEKDGWSVMEASDGHEALKMAAAQCPAMVLLDLSMPVMDGFRFLEELRRTPGCAEVPVVVMTGRELSRDDRQRLRGASQILNMGDVSLQGLTERLHKLAETPST